MKTSEGFPPERKVKKREQQIGKRSTAKNNPVSHRGDELKGGKRKNRGDENKMRRTCSPSGRSTRLKAEDVRGSSPTWQGVDKEHGENRVKGQTAADERVLPNEAVMGGLRKPELRSPRDDWGGGVGARGGKETM